MGKKSKDLEPWAQNDFRQRTPGRTMLFLQAEGQVMGEKKSEREKGTKKKWGKRNVSGGGR